MSQSSSSHTQVLQIFLSFSGEASEKFSLEIKKFLQELYKNQVSRQQIQFFCSVDNMSYDGDIHTAQERINKHLRQSNILISILTEKNLLSPWLMFEAGAVMTQEKGKVIPYNFGRDLSMPKTLEPIFSHLQRYEYQPFKDSINKDNFRKFLIELNSFIQSIEKELGDFRYSVDESHMDLFLEKKWKDYNKAIRGIFSKYLSETKYQSIFDFQWLQDIKRDNLTPITLFKYFRELKTKLEAENQFKAYPGKNSFYFQKLEQDLAKKHPDVHIVTLGDEKGLRLSTFVAFVCLPKNNTECAKILLYRRKDSSNTIIKNDGWDIFGSVAFDAEGALESKLGSSPLLQKKIQKIIPIHGIAFEENSLGSMSRQSVTMMGVLAVMDKEVLENSSNWRNEQCFLLDIKPNNDDNLYNIENMYTKFIANMTKPHHSSTDNDSRNSTNAQSNSSESVQNQNSESKKVSWQELYTSKAWLSIKALQQELNKMRKPNGHSSNDSTSNDSASNDSTSNGDV